MNPAIFSYIVKSTLGLALFFLFYITMLSKERFYGFNRFYLLSSLIFTLVVPLLTLPAFIPTKEMGDFLDFSLNVTTSPQIRIEESGFEKSSPFLGTITSLYWAVTLFVAIRFFYSIFKLTTPKSIHSVKYYNGYKIVLVDNLAFPYTFLSTIYVNSKDYIENKIPPELFAHEIVHVSGFHSLETIFLELLKIFYWFNPMLYIYKKAINLNHEYLADRAVTMNSGNNQPYINILLENSFRNNNTYLASSFNYSFIKKRIIMMTNDRISKRAILKKIATIPLFLTLGLLIINGQDPKTVSTAPPPPPPPPTNEKEIVGSTDFVYTPPQIRPTNEKETAGSTDFVYTPPSPPPPQPTNEMWWYPILVKNNITLDPAKCLTSEEFVETGEQFSREGLVISMKNAFIVIKSVQNLYRIIRASSVTHDLVNSTLKAESGTIETYERGNNGDKLIVSEKYNIMEFKLSKGTISPPPPPPPPAPTSTN